ncbi:hypothetical protein WK69_06455 [Burkholderia ubonensis]|uniref:replication protein RepA n=1 Tax=Burkholderia ubonensis TaxID=101571 RepID=UPI00075A9FF4|nr:replication protein RepA [Burkholderia ubonensis]KVU51290.1 hypothetical protein WK69_06455 [Burkholderia ubonensis]
MADVVVERDGGFAGRSLAFEEAPAWVEKPMRRIDRALIEEAIQIEQEEALRAGAVGYMARTLAQVTLPHSNPNTLYYERTSGKLTLAVRGHKAYGVPFGSIPRVLLAWICTEAVITKDPALQLGRSAKEFAGKLQMHYNGRDLARLKTQCLALARAVISVDAADKLSSSLAFEDIKLAKRGFVFWSDKDHHQQSLWESTLILTDDFYEAVTTRPVPIDMRVFHALSKSPLAMDIYTWLTYRMFVLRVSGRREALIPWLGLKAQFGSRYADDAQGLRDFKKNFLTQLSKVLLFYPEADDYVTPTSEHLKLTPCAIHLAASATCGSRLWKT